MARAATPLPAFVGAEGTTKALLAWGESRAAAAAAARRVDRGAIVGFRSKNESERPQQAKVRESESS